MIYILAGRIAAGKSTLAKSLAKIQDGRILKTSTLLEGNNRLEKQREGDLKDANGCLWLLDSIANMKPKPMRELPVIIDSVRNLKQVNSIKGQYKNSVLIYADCEPDTSYVRLSARGEPNIDITTKHRNESDFEQKSLKLAADLIVYTGNGSIPLEEIFPCQST